MKEGEKYLSVKLVGHEFVTAFPNQKTKPEQPDFKGDGVAVWVKEKRASKEGEVKSPL